MEKRTRAIQKIKKLLGMVRRGTIHEKEIALLQAQRLMAKHHIEGVEVEGEEVEKVVRIFTEEINVRKVTWQYLMVVIASNFKCKYFTSWKSKTWADAVFMGLETDALVAKEVFEAAYGFATREARSIASYYYQHYGSSKGVSDEWIIGFINGLEQGFADQIVLSNETAIMVVIPPEVEEEYTNISWSDKELNSLDVQRNGHADLFNAGYANGYHFANNKNQGSLDDLKR